MNVRKLTKGEKEALELNRQYKKNPHGRVKAERPAKKTRRWSEVFCEKHGKRPMKQNEMPLGQALKVSAKGERHEKTAGCPICKKEHE